MKQTMVHAGKEPFIPGVGRGPGGRWTFCVWAPLRERVSLKVVSEKEREVVLHRDRWGYWRGDLEVSESPIQYLFVLDGSEERPDPASHFQPHGVHGPSEAVDHAAFGWTDAHWRGMPLKSFVIYELHTGTFTPEGTFEAIIPRLDELKELGVTAVELMPVCAFPGARNWGYDGVYPYSVHEAYGGPTGLKTLVDACHARGLAVVLDVVYNHLGPEGNYLSRFGPYFTARYHTPWGDAVNFDDAWCDGVRRFFIGNALHWFSRYHIDALRLDAVHGIVDTSPRHFLAELAGDVAAFRSGRDRGHYLIAESDQNDPRIVAGPERGGYGIDAQWSDDFHHALHVLLTGEREGYYEDFGERSHLARACERGFVYAGDYSSFRRRRHGDSPEAVPLSRLVVCSQNHDQIGNRMRGERLSTLVCFEAAKTAAAATVFAANLPLLFMGEEYFEQAPFQFFVSHGDPALVEAVREGRAREFSSFKWEGEVPDPQSEETFSRSKLSWDSRRQGRHNIMREFYRTLLLLRRTTPALTSLNKERLRTWVPEGSRVLLVERLHEDGDVVLAMNFAETTATLQSPSAWGGGVRLLDTAEKRWGGEGPLMDDKMENVDSWRLRPWSTAVYLL